MCCTAKHLIPVRCDGDEKDELRATDAVVGGDVIQYAGDGVWRSVVSVSAETFE